MPVLPDDYETDIELLRFSQDNIINHSGRKVLEFCKSQYAMADMGKIKGWESSDLLGLMDEAWLIT